MDNEDVVDLLVDWGFDVTVRDVEALGDELDVADDEWRVEDVEDAADLLSDEGDQNDGDLDDDD